MTILLDPDIVAKYVLQVTLSHQKKTKGMHLLGSILLWRKPGVFGRADELMKLCPKNGCLGFFRDSFYLTKEEQDLLGDKVDNPSKWPKGAQVRYATWFQHLVACPLCGTMETRERLPDSYMFNMSKDRIAARMASFFRLLDHSADIYMVRTKRDGVQQHAKSEVAGPRDRYAKLLAEARDRDNVYYGLKDLLKDTEATGLEGRFRSLLGA
ncbi:MAG: hypothetical protein HN396_17625 [Gemmatimonadales bacterium]|jgi:hypothetical protein|nr:hypothetical protein [Gemmatimonadales bacterium]